MEFEESIFNLIEKEAYVAPKAKRHVSKHDPNQAPTATTFKSAKNTTGTFGLPKGAARPNANQFRLKGTGTFQLPDGKYHPPSLTPL